MTTWTPVSHQTPRDRLAFTRIQINRAPGIAPGFSLDNLSPDITIVYGPNASGKSTTARAIQALLWPGQSALRGHELAGEFTIGNDVGTIHADSSRIARTRNGQPAESLAVAPIDDRIRYTLGLHDLLASENQPLAQAILTESSGGFDLDAVADALNYDRVIPPRLTAARDVDSARARLRDADRAEEVVHDDLRQLNATRQRLRDAHGAQTDADALRRALHLHKTRQELDQARADLAAFPEQMLKLTGNEMSELSRLNLALDEIRVEIDHAVAARDRAEKDYRSLDLPHGRSEENVLTSLRQQVATVRRLESELSRADRDVERAAAERASIQARLANDVEDEQIEQLDAAGIRELADLANAYEDIRARRRARDEVELWIGGATPPANIDDLRSGVQFLQHRVQHPNRTEAGALTGKAQLAGYVGGLLAIAGAIWLATFVDRLWLLFGLLGIAVIWYTWKYGIPDTTESEHWEQQYAGLDLPQPASWTMPDVRTTLNSLQEDLRVALVEQEKADRWADLEDERADLDAAYADTEQRRSDAIARFGVAPDLKEESLRLIADNLTRWQNADSSLRGRRAERARVQQELDDQQAALKDDLGEYGYSDHNIDGDIADLERRFREASIAQAEFRTRSSEIDNDLAGELSRREAARVDFFRNLGLENSDRDGLRALIDRRADWLEARQLVSDRDSAAREAHVALSMNPELRDLSPDELRQRLEDAEHHITSIPAIEQELAGIRDRITTAYRSTAKADALGRLEDARHALRRERDRVTSSVLGDLLITSTREATRDAALPLVFHRARELFGIITRGRYELQFEPGPPPAFTALDTTTGGTLNLDQLSSGTRVQVLMAIRLAFVETVENGPKLPVLLDETLGNSDEIRAGAIIDAAIDIARNGRQVFYFTAQADEVVRWKARVQQIPVEERPVLTVVDLSEIRQQAGFDRMPIPDATDLPETRFVPSPDDYDADTWRRALRVPAIDRWADTSGQLHLWHVIDDPHLLHELMIEDISTWGQLQSLQRTNGQDALNRIGIDERSWERAAAKVQLIESAIGMWRLGHARPVTPSALAESGVVDAAAIDELSALLEEVDGEGERLLARLLGMDDPPIAGKPLERLETFLIGEGYHPQGGALPEAAIRQRLISAARTALARDIISPNDIERILRSTLHP